MAKQRGENLHDKFFRETFGEPRMAAEFLRHYLPPDLAAALDLNQLEVLKESFVDEELQEHFSDLLCRAPLRTGSAVFIYILIEHKSGPAPWVALQLLRYMLKIWAPVPQRRGAKLPVIFPLVFYHGRRRWNVARHFNALFDAAALAKVRQYVPEFEYFLCDLSVRSRTPVRGDQSLQAALLALRGIFDERIIEWLSRVAQLLLEDEEGAQQLQKIFAYWTRARDLELADMQQAIKEAKASQRSKRAFKKTYLDEWEERGWQKGHQQGRREGREEGREAGREAGREEGALLIALRQLERRFGAIGARQQKRLYNLSLAQLEQLSEALLDFRSPRDLSAWLKEHPPAKSALPSAAVSLERSIPS